MAVKRNAAVLSSIALVVVAVTLPNTELSRLRSHYRWIGRPMNWIESVWPAINFVHVVLFALVGTTLRFAFPSVRLGRLIATMVILASVSELVQYGVPGRTPRLSDVGLDVVGALIGIAVATLMLWISRRVRLRT